MAECLHCVISELLQARGAVASRQSIGNLLEVAADMIKSGPNESRAELTIFAIGLLLRLTERDVELRPVPDSVRGTPCAH